MLYFQGTWALAETRCVAVVGSRTATEDGLRRAAKISRALVEKGFTVVSGLALGIDAAAHTAAIEAGGRTIAVIGTPIGVYYPREGAPPLPVTPLGWEEMRHEISLNSLIGFYARSLAIRNWEVHNHPAFENFARGLLAIDTGLWNLQQRVGPSVLKRYQPCALAGMTPGAYWAPPDECEKFMAEVQTRVSQVAADEESGIASPPG